MNYYLVDNLCCDDNREEFTLKHTSRRKPSISAGDHAIFYNKTHHDVIFLFSAQIDGIYIEEMVGKEYEPDMESEGSAINLISYYKLANQSVFEHRRKLTELLYSLEKIYRFKEPLKHFRRNYTGLSAADYFTIKNNSIYWPRTLFGFFMNALPKTVKQEVYVYLIENDISIQIEKDYIKLWDLLKKFINQNYITAYELLKRMSDISVDILDAGYEFDNLFIEVEGDGKYHLNRKLGHLEQFTGAWNEVIRNEFDYLAEDESESVSLQRNFDIMPWPVEI